MSAPRGSQGAWRAAPGQSIPGLDVEPAELSREATRVILYRDAYEATVVTKTGRRQPPGRPRARERDHARESLRRAERTARRYIVANRLGTMLTLTLSEPDADRGRLIRLTDDFIVRLRREVFGGRPIPWLRVIEGHDSDRLHVHLLVPRCPTQAMKRHWPHGHSNIRRAADSGSWSRRLRGLAAYVVKSLADVPDGQHRYEVAQGFAVGEPIRITAGSAAEALDRLTWIMRSQPDRTVHLDLPEAFGVSIVLLEWDLDPPTRPRSAPTVARPARRGFVADKAILG